MALDQIFAGVIAGDPTALEQLLGLLTFDILLPTCIVLVVLAFFGLRLYKICMSVTGAYGLGMVAYYISAEMIENGTLQPFAENISEYNTVLIISLAAAAVGFLLGTLLDKIVLFLGGAAGGYFATGMLAGMFFPDMLTPEVLMVVAAVVGVVLGILLCVLFKFVYIIITSLGGMALTGAIVGFTFFPEDMNMVLIYTIGGAVIGIIPAIVQFKKDSE